jgi:signal transduction histidine kinase
MTPRKRNAQGSGNRSDQDAAPTLHPAFPVVAAMVLVLGTFAGSLAYLHSVLQPIDQRALTIYEDAVPSIEHIDAAHNRLMETGADLTRYLGLQTDAEAVRQSLWSARAGLDSELKRFGSLPAIAEESRLLDKIRADLSLLDGSITRAVDEKDSGNREAAFRTLAESVEPLLLRADRDLQDLRRLNEGKVQIGTAQILRARRKHVRSAFILGILGSVFAIGATALLLRVLRSRGRLMEEHGRLQASRATELDAFAGRVAHDLRDPVHATAMGLAFLAIETKHSGARARECIEGINRQLDHMRSVIEGLLDFARAGADPTPGARADLTQTLGEVVSALRSSAESEHVELNLSAFPATTVVCTPGALTSVLSNVLSNAVKYVREGTKLPHQVNVSVEQRADVVRIEIEDNGPGLPAGADQRIFEPFTRLETHQTGTGLGLATVKRIVEAYNGHVGVNSELGKGSRFWVELQRIDTPVPAVVDSVTAVRQQA